MDEAFQNECKKSNEEYSERNQQISQIGENCKVTVNRAEALMEIIDRFIALKYRRKFTRKIWMAWKSVHSDLKREKMLEIYSDNFQKRRLMQKCFIQWRKDTHTVRKHLIEQEYTFKMEKMKTGRVGECDKTLREMLAKIEAAKRILKEEIDAKEHLTQEYELALGRGVGALSKETQVISSNPIIGGMHIW